MALHLQHRQQWRLRGLGEDYLIVRCDEFLSQEIPRRVPEGLLSFLMERWMADSLLRRVLSDIHEALGGTDALSGLTVLQQRQVLDRLKLQLLDAFRSGRLVAVREEPLRYVSPPRLFKPTPSPTPSEEFVATSWIALRLEDEEGEPLPRQRYRLKLADGSFREGISGPDGLVRLENIPKGTCTVEFLGTDAGDWKAA
ncbi:hypothetical protein [Cystobacter ferrugineus]|uniref:Carboxypeptidase regulatory-like domain-containing protein n=1 Tax=Cystobacter ferrugineus TaxID=83449 RepID=A0A1L9BJF7_9BACT|nr:hypothetical protein [Cystobacter ferrugineus]OJH42345.1 hypothetical protein BON30_03840 [Cystobacter ferrugineus]